MHGGNSDKTVKCTVTGCSSEFSCRGNLNRHIRISHVNVYHQLIASSSVHPRARTISAITEMYSISTNNNKSTNPTLPIASMLDSSVQDQDHCDDSRLQIATEATITRTFRCSHKDCMAELTSHETRIRHEQEVHGNKKHQCNIDGCSQKFARKEQLRSHAKCFHGVVVSSATEVWSTDNHPQSYFYGPRRKCLKMLQTTVEIQNHLCTTTQSQEVVSGSIPLQTVSNTLMEHCTFENINEHSDDDEEETTVTDYEKGVICTEMPSFLTQTMVLASISQVSNMFSNDIIPSPDEMPKNSPRARETTSLK